MSDISGFLSAFHRPSAGLIQAARQLLSDERAPLRQKLLADLLHTISENIAAETRAEDPPWFEGSGDAGSGRACLEPPPRGDHQISSQFPGQGLPGSLCSQPWHRPFHFFTVEKCV